MPRSRYAIGDRVLYLPPFGAAVGEPAIVLGIGRDDDNPRRHIILVELVHELGGYLDKSRWGYLDQITPGSVPRGFSAAARDLYRFACRNHREMMRRQDRAGRAYRAGLKGRRDRYASGGVERAAWCAGFEVARLSSSALAVLASV